MNYRILPIRPSSAELASLVHRGTGFPDPWDAKSFRELLAMPGTGGYFALEDDEPTPLGLMLWRIAAGEAEILTVGVVREHRRRGVGRFLIESAIAAMREAAATQIFLEVAVDNAPAIALYAEFGFKKRGLRRAYYRTPLGPVDASVLSKELS